MSTKNNTKLTGTEGTIRIKLADIICNNYRKSFDEPALNAMAASIRIYDVIQPILLSPLPDGKYLLVVGERRFRAAKIAGKKDIPATIRAIDEKDIREIQLIENLQRADVPPLEEAKAFLELINQGKEIKEIAAAVGCSQGQVYYRIKLNNLAQPLQQMLEQNKLQLSVAYELCKLSDSSQVRFFENNFASDWEDEDYIPETLADLNYKLKRFKGNLSDVSFSLKKKNVFPDATACIGCQFNSSTLTSLFPDEEKGYCADLDCFVKKCEASATLILMELVAANPYLPLIASSMEIFDQVGKNFNDRERLLLGKDCSKHYIPDAPDTIDRSDFEDDGEFDELNYAEALEDYNQELLEYQQDIANVEVLIKQGNVFKGIFLSNGSAATVLCFVKGTHKCNSTNNENIKPVSAKVFQDAKASGNLTTDNIIAEKQRLQQREERSLELDKEKIHTAIYEAVEATVTAIDAEHPITKSERATMAFLLWNMTGWNSKKNILLTFFGKDNFERDELFYAFSGVTNEQMGLLTRIALLNQSSAKFVTTSEGYFLHQLAEEKQDVDTIAIKLHQDGIAEERYLKYSEKINHLDSLLKKEDAKDK